ncbi:hypothetical protein [Candidatus Lariskella endosymbiont of Hedychridium roseum]|uniref:hypothetical protein n=1 Tax=Candidatus Lariskella endosymbiont of Hedychridium roseum TaxID=3077949 RepID=UPI0030CAC62C
MNMMKKRILCVFAYITCVLFVAACGHNEFTASEQSSSLDSLPLSALPASQYNPITGKFVDEINKEYGIWWLPKSYGIPSKGCY